MGWRMSTADRTTEQFYRTILQKAGGNTNVPIEFAWVINDKLEVSKTIVINHKVLYESLKD